MVEHLTTWHRDRKLLEVKTNNSARPWRGRLVNNETQFDEALELELEKDAGRVVVIPWHAVEYVRCEFIRRDNLVS